MRQDLAEEFDDAGLYVVEDGGRQGRGLGVLEGCGGGEGEGGE